MRNAALIVATVTGCAALVMTGSPLWGAALAALAFMAYSKKTAS